MSEFEPGKVYVVEFWATWCGPCIAGMPHLSEMQKTYGKKGVTIIGVNVWDDPSKVEPFMKNKGGNDLMQYTVGIEQKIEGEDVSRTGEMDRAWMKPAEQRGIPASFVVDKAGKIAYVGHPMWLDIPVQGVLDGTWNSKTGMAKIKEAEAMLMKAYRAGSPEERLEAFDAFEAKYPAVAHQSMFTSMKLDLLMATKQYSRAWDLAGKLVDEAIKKDDVQTLNSIAWSIVDPEGDVSEPNLPLALKAARAANAATGEEDAAILDTLARVYWNMGEKSHAIELQRKAVEHAEGPMKAGIEGALKEYEEAVRTGG